jgi:hypothetical protein
MCHLSFFSEVSARGLARFILLWLLSKRYLRSPLKVARPERLADKVAVNPGASPSSTVFFVALGGAKTLPSGRFFLR